MILTASSLLWLVIVLFTLANTVAAISSSEDRGLSFPAPDPGQGASSSRHHHHQQQQQQAATLSSPVLATPSSSSPSSSTQAQQTSLSQNVILPKIRRRRKRHYGVVGRAADLDQEEEEEGEEGGGRHLDKFTRTWARNVKQRLKNKLDVIRSEPYGRDRLSGSSLTTRAGKPLTLRWTWNDARNLAMLEAEGIPGTAKVKQLVTLTKMANPRFTGQPDAEEVFRVVTGDQKGDSNAADRPRAGEGEREELHPLKLKQQTDLAEEIFRERLPIAVQYGRPNPFGLDATLVARLGTAGLHHLDELHRHVSVKETINRLDGAAPDEGGEAGSSSAAIEGGALKKWQERGAGHATMRRGIPHLRKRVTQKLRLQATPSSEMGRPRLWTTDDAADLRRLILSGSTRVFKYVKAAQRANPNFNVEGVDPDQERIKRKREKVEAFFEQMKSSHRMIPGTDRTTTMAEASGAEERVEQDNTRKRVAVSDNSESLQPDLTSMPEEKSASPTRLQPYHRPRQMRISRAFITSRHPPGPPHVEHIYRNPLADQVPVRPVLAPFRQVHPPLAQAAHQQPSSTSTLHASSRHHVQQLASLLTESMPPQSSISLSFAQPHTPPLPARAPLHFLPSQSKCDQQYSIWASAINLLAGLLSAPSLRKETRAKGECAFADNDNDNNNTCDTAALCKLTSSHSTTARR